MQIILTKGNNYLLAQYCLIISLTLLDEREKNEWRYCLQWPTAERRLPHV